MDAPNPLASPDELALPRPRPFRNLKRAAYVLATLLLGLLSLRWEWGRRLTNRLEARVAEYRHRGEPTRLSDFATPPLPQDQDALFYLRQAKAAFVQPVDSNTYEWEWPAGTTVDPDHERRTRRMIADNGRAFDLLRRALACPGANWDVREFDPETINADDNAATLMHKALIAASTVAHRDGDDEAAMARIHEGLAFARLWTASPTWLGQQYRSFSETQFADQATTILDELRIKGDVTAAADPPPPPNRNAIPASPRRVRQVIDALLEDDEPSRRGIARALQIWRALLYEEMTAAAQGRPWTYFGGKPSRPQTPLALSLHRAVGPYFLHVAAREMDYLTALIRVAEQPDLAAAGPYLPPAFRLPHPPTLHFVNVLDADLPPAGSNQAVTDDFRSRAARRAAAVRLAARLYQADHGPARPASVAHLVPKYLPRIPADPVNGVASPQWRLPATRPTSRPTPKQ